MSEYSDVFGRGGLNDQVDTGRLLDDIGLNREEIRWRKEFVGFDEEDERRLQQYQDLFDENAEQVADAFYENLTAHEQTVDVIGRSPKNVDQLKRTQSAYLTTLVDGEYGREYFRNRARIGKLHELLDMPIKHYIGQYGVYYDLILPLIGDRLTESLVNQIGDRVEPDGGTTAVDDRANADTESSIRDVIEAEVDDAMDDMLAILRIINLDMQVATETYLDSYNKQLKSEIERNKRIMREAENDVEQPMQELMGTAEEVAERAEEISDIADGQTEQVDDISAEVSDLSATVEEIASTADQVENASDRAESLAMEGQESADEAVGVMDDIGEAVVGVADDVDSLQSRIGEIDEVVDVINDIAEQTNILALNASIEAARAGEAGSGFAVVADEVKSLAGESQEHAGEIEALVDDIQADTEETVENLESTTEQVSRGVESVEDSMENLEHIVDAIQETARGISEVAQATDDQATSAEAIAGMVDDLVVQADRVSTEVDDLAAANKKQASMVEGVRDSVGRLTDA